MDAPSPLVGEGYEHGYQVRGHGFASCLDGVPVGVFMPVPLSGVTTERPDRCTVVGTFGSGDLVI
jgi:hypothetical protein